MEQDEKSSEEQKSNPAKWMIRESFKISRISQKGSNDQAKSVC